MFSANHGWERAAKRLLGELTKRQRQAWRD